MVADVVINAVDLESWWVCCGKGREEGGRE